MRSALVLMTLCSFLFATDETFDPDRYQIREIQAIRIAVPIVLDGLLNDDIYLGPSNHTFVQYLPYNGTAATERTEIWIAYDNEALYVGARMWDSSPDSIVSTIGRRDANYNTDLFEIIIDAYNDKRTGFSFQINPAGAINDQTYFNDSWTDDTWDGIWDGMSNIDDQGWTAEMRIPFSQLRFNQKDEYTWGVLATRYIQRHAEWDYFVYIPQVSYQLNPTLEDQLHAS